MFEKALFAPAPVLAADAAPPAGLSDLFITTHDGVRIHALYHPYTGDADGPRPVLLHLHGNGEHVYNTAPRAQILAEQVNVLAVSYRGYGKSDGRPTEAGVYADAAAAVRHLIEVKGFAERDIFIYGHSLGAAVAIHTAQGRAFRGLILEAPFLSGRAMAEHVSLAWVPGLGDPFDSAAKAPDVSSRVLLIHGDRDGIVPFEQGRRLFDRLGADDKCFLPVELAGHNDIALVAGDGYWQSLNTFLNDGRPC